MSSVRPKLKPETPKVVTAWDAPSGRTIYRTAQGDWTQNIKEADVLTFEAADLALAASMKDQIRANDAYLMEVSAEGEIIGRETLRESIRANGPTCHPQYGRQGGKQLMPAHENAKLTLFGDSISGNCLKARWVAERTNTPFEWIEMNLLKGDTRTEAFLAMNPSGQVPLARWADGRVLPQSNAIMLYLAEQANSDLIPADAFVRAQMHAWLFWEQYTHEPAIAVRRFKKHYLKLADDDIEPDLMAKGRRALGTMEMQLNYSDYLVGEQLSLADLACVAYTRWAHEGGFDLNEFPAVRRWVARVETDLGLDHAYQDIPHGDS